MKITISDEAIENLVSEEISKKLKPLEFLNNWLPNFIEQKKLMDEHLSFFERIFDKISQFQEELEEKISKTNVERKKFTPPYDVEYGILSHKIEAYKEVLAMFQEKFIGKRMTNWVSVKDRDK